MLCVFNLSDRAVALDPATLSGAAVLAGSGCEGPDAAGVLPPFGVLHATLPAMQPVAPLPLPA